MSITTTVEPEAVAEAIARFKAGLRRERRQAGEPSYSDIERVARARQALSKPTISRALTGKAFPNWRVTEGILFGCGLNEQDIVSWRTRWASVRDLVQPLEDEGSMPAAGLDDDSSDETGAPAGEECESCGAWVTNKLRHHEWHIAIERRPRLRSVPGSTNTLDLTR
jgi:hypothetical protein